MRYESHRDLPVGDTARHGRGMISLPSGEGVTHRPSLCTSYRREHAAARAKTSCQLAVVSRGPLDEGPCSARPPRRNPG
jgi:hypothetical protein